MKWQKARILPGSEPSWTDNREVYVLKIATRTTRAILEGGESEPMYVTNIKDENGNQMRIAQSALVMLPIFRAKVALVSLGEFKAGVRI